MKALSFVFAAAIAAAAVTGPAKAAEFEWRMDVNLVETRPEAKLLGAFAERINSNAGGRLEIKTFYGGSLGIKSADTLRALKAGSVEMAQLYAGYFGRDAPDLALALVQGAILDPQENIEIQPTVQEIYREFYEDWDVDIVGWILANSFSISVMCRDEPINSLAQLKGKKLRVWAKDQVETFEKLGVAAQIVPQNDLYVAMQTGVVDCALYVLGIAHTISLQEVTDYAASLHTYSVVPSAVGVSGKYWKELPKDLQDVVLEAGQWMYAESLRTINDTSAEDAAREKFLASGELEVLPPFSAADRKTFYDAAVEVWADSAKEVGRKAPEYQANVTEALAKIRSGK